MITIRKAEARDTHLVYDLTKTAFTTYSSHFPDAQVPAMAETQGDVLRDIQNHRVFIAFSDGLPAGSIRLKQTGSGFLFTRLGVLPGHREAGIGPRLITRVEGEAEMLGGTRIYLKTAARIKKLIDFYIGLGYSLREIKTGGEYHLAVLGKELGSSLTEVA